jgi:hypothetical protein
MSSWLDHIDLLLGVIRGGRGSAGDLIAWNGVPGCRMHCFGQMRSRATSVGTTFSGSKSFRSQVSL